MKRALTTGYTFTAATKTLDFSSTSGFNARYLVAVVNVTQRVMIYGVGITGKGYTSLTGGNVFVLQYDTTTHSDSDVLYIIYDDIGGDATNGLDVDVTRVIPGTSATHLGKAEDAAHSSGDTGVMALAVRKDTAAALAGTDGDYIPIITDASGQLWVNVGASALPSGAATSAKQDTGNTSLASIDAGTPAALGQTNKAGGMPIIAPIETGSGSINANATDAFTALDLRGFSSVIVQITGTFSGTIQCHASVDNSTFLPAVAGNNAVTGANITSLSTTGIFMFPAGCYIKFRSTAWSSGTATVTAVGAQHHIPATFITAVNSQGASMLAAGSVGDAGNGSGTQSVGLSLYNGSNWDRARNVTAVSLLTSSARTTTQTGADATNYNFRGLILYVNVTSAGTGSITPSLDIKDSVSAAYKTIWTAASAITSNGLYVYALTIGAASAASFTEAVQVMLGRTFRINITANNANSVTYSVSYDLLPF